MSYIGNSPVLKATEDREEFTVTTASQSIFHTNGYNPDFISVYLNGSRLATSDFTATDGSTLTLTTAALIGDIVACEYRYEVTQGVSFGEAKQEILITNTSTTTYTLNSTPIADYTQVHYNGVLLSHEQNDYSLNNKDLTLNFTLSLNDVITVIMRRGIEVVQAGEGVAEVREEFTVSGATQTIFTTTAAIVANLTDVYKNGVKLSVGDFTIDAANKKITLTIAAVTNDIIAVVSKTSVTAAHQIFEHRQEFLISDSTQKSYTASSFLAASHTDVYLNGVRLNRADFSINKYTVTLTEFPNVNDILVVVSRNSLSDAVKTGATGGGTDEIFWTNDTTITQSYSIPVNKNAMSAGPITVSNGVIVTVPNGSTWTVV